MADITSADLAALQNPYAEQLVGLNRQQALAQLLLQQGQQQPQGQMISGRYVKPNPLQNINNLLQTAVGLYGQKQAENKQLELAKQIRELGAQETKDIFSTLKGTPEVTTELAGPAYKGVAPTAVMPATEGNPDLALSKALMGQSPQAKALVPNLIEQTMPKQIPEQIKYKMAVQGGYKGTFNDFINQMSEKDKADIALRKQEIGLQSARLGFDREKLAQEMSGGKLTEFQGKATNFGVQMAGSAAEMAAVEKAGFDPASTKNQILLSTSGTTLGNYMVSPEVQRYKQAMDNFTENFIRFKSGANVPMHEIEKDLKNMMPQQGDSLDKIEQKQRARERALQGMVISAGPGAKYIGEAFKFEAPPMKSESTTQPKANANATPSLWGKATVVSQ